MIALSFSTELFLFTPVNLDQWMGKLGIYLWVVDGNSRSGADDGHIIRRRRTLRPQSQVREVIALMLVWSWQGLDELLNPVAIRATPRQSILWKFVYGFMNY
jgi:hypothetical protein